VAQDQWKTCEWVRVWVVQD